MTIVRPEQPRAPTPRGRTLEGFFVIAVEPGTLALHCDDSSWSRGARVDVRRSRAHEVDGGSR
jgi:hypothetical protein